MRRILLLLLLISLALSFLNFLPRFFWWQEANQTLWLYYIILQLLSVILIAADRNLRKLKAWRICLAILLISLVMYSSRIVRFYLPGKPGEGAAPLHVLFIDESIWRDRVPVVRADLPAESSADVVITLSGSNSLVDTAPGLEAFPYMVSTMASGSQNFSLHSRSPFEGDPRTNVGKDMPPTLIARVGLISGPVTIAAMQMLPPADSISVFINDVYVRRLGTQLRYLDGPVVLLGVMHTVPFSRVHSTFMHVSRMRNASKGLGLMRVWDPGVILPFFPGTHFFVKGSARMVSRTYADGTIFGSFLY